MYNPLSVVYTHSLALYEMAKSLPENLPYCINKLHTTKGRIICVGIGKSAFILQKISSSFASVGLASQFLDPIQGAHGDLGGLKEHDIILAGSYGGESTELIPILSFTQEKNIFSILMTAFPSKRLAQIATATLLLPQVKEAGPLGCVPSTSSLVMLVLGDILVSALECNITLEQYRSHHPHGALGLKLAPVTQTMSSGNDLPLVTLTTLTMETLIIMSEKRLGFAGVLNEAGQLVGVISDGDVRRACVNLGDITPYFASDIMKKNPKTVPAHAIVEDALKVMEHYKITFVFVVSSEHKPLGMIHMHDSWKNVR